MPVYKVDKRELCWGIWKMDETIEELASLFPDGNRLMQEAVHRFSNANRRKEWLAARALLFFLSEEKHEIAYLSSGKPYLKDSFWHISISHTENYVAVALHPRLEIGIDIERYATKVLRVKERFMREDEKAEGKEIEALLLHWSAKETLYKLIGQEEVDMKEHLRILPFFVRPEGAMQAYEYKTPEKKNYTVFYRIEQDFVMTWCVNEMTGNPL